MQSSKTKQERLRKIKVLVADPDTHITGLVRDVLQSFGFEHIYIVRSGAEAVAFLKEQAVDLIITEWPMAPMDGINFVQYARKDSGLARRDVPIIMLTGKAESVDVEKARDSGVTEFVVKPFSAKTLSHRITQVIDNPRTFVFSKFFTGPDRRRKPADDGTENKRMPLEEMEKHAVPKGDKTVYRIHGQEITLQHPNRVLQKIIGSDITAENIFNEASVKAAQEVIMNMSDEFLGWVSIDINRLEHAYKSLSQHPDDKQKAGDIKTIAATIKAQAGTFGYHFATAVGKHLYDFMLTIDHVDEDILVIIRKHIDTLYVIFQKEIHGEVDNIGDEVLHNLERLTEKYKPADDDSPEQSA